MIIISIQSETQTQKPQSDDYFYDEGLDTEKIKEIQKSKAEEKKIRVISHRRNA